MTSFDLDAAQRLADAYDALYHLCQSPCESGTSLEGDRCANALRQACAEIRDLRAKVEVADESHRISCDTIADLEAERIDALAKLARMEGFRNHWRDLAQRTEKELEAVTAERDKLHRGIGILVADAGNECLERAEKAEAQAQRYRQALDDISFWKCGCGATWASDKAKAAIAAEKEGE